MFGGDSIMSFNQKEYIDGYNKSTYKMIPFRVRKDNTDVLIKLSSVPSVNGYINDLIDKDINVLSIKQIKERAIPIFHKYSIKEVYLFGSYARGEARSDSDVDIYCEKGDVDTMWKFSSFLEELEQALNKKVDVVTIGSQMHDYFKQQLEADKIRIC